MTNTVEFLCTTCGSAKGCDAHHSTSSSTCLHLLKHGACVINSQVIDAGNCKVVLGRADTENSSHVTAVDLTLQEGTQPRATSETTVRVAGHGVRAMQSMPMPTPFATASLPSADTPQGFLGRGLLGERPSIPPLLTMHQLGSQDRFVVRLVLQCLQHNLLEIQPFCVAVEMIRKLSRKLCYVWRRCQPACGWCAQMQHRCSVCCSIAGCDGIDNCMCCLMTDYMDTHGMWLSLSP